MTAQSNLKAKRQEKKLQKRKRKLEIYQNWDSIIAGRAGRCKRNGQLHGGGICAKKT